MPKEISSYLELCNISAKRNLILSWIVQYKCQKNFHPNVTPPHNTSFFMMLFNICFYISFNISVMKSIFWITVFLLNGWHKILSYFVEFYGVLYDNQSSCHWHFQASSCEVHSRKDVGPFALWLWPSTSKLSLVTDHWFVIMKYIMSCLVWSCYVSPLSEKDKFVKMLSVVPKAKIHALWYNT